MSLSRCTCVRSVGREAGDRPAIDVLAADPWCPANAVHQRVASGGGPAQLARPVSDAPVGER